jgi:FkbM family methyltransferase
MASLILTRPFPATWTVSFAIIQSPQRGLTITGLDYMTFIKSLERLGKHLALTPKVLLRYGKFYPSRIRLVGCDHWVHIDPSDRRAVKKFIYDPIRGRVSPPLAFWRDFTAHLKPAVVLDVGVNYGECLFGARYSPQTKAYGFEANPRIIPYLQKSRLEHPDAHRVTIVEGLVSDGHEDAVPFYSDPTWSGTGSAIRSLHGDARHLITNTIPSSTIDSVIPLLEIKDNVLLFKMDIEGFESRAFGGFWKTIGAAKLAVGFIEFDTTYIREAGVDSKEYFAILSDKFDIYRLQSGQTKSLVPVQSFDRLPVSMAADQRVHTDLLLCTRGEDSSEWLPNHWKISRPDQEGLAI